MKKKKELRLEFTPEYLAKLDELAQKFSMTRQDFIDLIENVLYSLECADEETVEEILNSGYLSTEDLDLDETADPAKYYSGFSVTFRFEEITRDDCENWEEYFSHFLSRMTGEE